MIRTYDNKPDETMAALREKKDSEQKDLPRLRLLLQTLDAAKPGTPERAKAAAAVAAFHKEHTSPKFAARMADPNNKPPSKQGAKNSDRKLEVQAERKARALRVLENTSQNRAGDLERRADSRQAGAGTQVAQAKSDRTANSSTKDQVASMLDAASPKSASAIPGNPPSAQQRVALVQPTEAARLPAAPASTGAAKALKNDVASLLESPAGTPKGATVPVAADKSDKKTVVAQLQPAKGAKPPAGPKIG